MSDLSIGDKLNNDLVKLFNYKELHNIKGYVQVTTPFILADGTNLDLFIKSEDDYYLVTDLGETYGWFCQTRVEDTKFMEIVKIQSDLLVAYGVTEKDGQLRILVTKHKNLAEAVIRLAELVSLLTKLV